MLNSSEQQDHLDNMRRRNMNKKLKQIKFGSTDVEPTHETLTRETL